MANGRIYNFSAGPSMLPLEVLERAGKEITNYQGSGMSVMEMSHRSKVFQKIFDDTKAKFKKLMAVPDDYEVLFLQGGASTQFSAIPLNLIGSTGKADYAVTGNFSNLAYQEAKKYGDIAVACTSEDQDFSYIPTQDKIVVRPDASYFYYCANNTIYGTEWQYIPETGNVPIVCDMSSDICSRQVDVSRYGVIYAGAQKNLAPAGVTIVIVKKELAGHELPITPKMLGWQIDDREGLHVQHAPLLVHLYAGSGVRLAGEQGWRRRYGEDQARQGSDAVRCDRRLPSVPLRGSARFPQRHERHLPHRLRRAGCQVCGRERRVGLQQPEGSPQGGRYACLHLQRHAHRGRRKAVRVHQALRSD